MDLDVGAKGQVERIVTEADTAIAFGSGDVPVLATPRLIAWAEAATVAALDPRLEPGTTSVGSRVVLEHRTASRIGTSVTVTAELIAADGRQLRFTVAASDDRRIVAAGEVTRVIVDRERFLRSRSSSAGTPPPDR
jgi:predicted thioesterase